MEDSAPRVEGSREEGIGIEQVGHHSDSSSISMQADTGQTSAHSAHPEQRSSRTIRGASWSLGAGRIAFSGQVFMQAPQPAQASVTEKMDFKRCIPSG
jgi:hypothetical protein